MLRTRLNCYYSSIFCSFKGFEVFPIEKDHEGSAAGKLEKHYFADNVLV